MTHFCVLHRSVAKMGVLFAYSVGERFRLAKQQCVTQTGFGSRYASPVGDSLILVSLTRHATSFLLCCRRPQSISALLFVHLAIGHHMHDGAQAKGSSNVYRPTDVYDELRQSSS